MPIVRCSSTSSGQISWVATFAIAPSTCLQPFQPGVDPATFATDYAAFVAYAVDSSGNAADVPAEPALKPYVFARR